jgi:hypothetical protein
MAERDDQSGTDLPGGRYCRNCGYDLRASKDRCPECGQPFDPANPRTFRKRPASACWWWFRWTTAVVLVLAMAWGGMVGWLWWGWRAEEKEVQSLTQSRAGRVMARPAAYPTLERLLPERMKYLTQRVTEVYGWETMTDAGLAHLVGMKQMQVLWPDDTQITDAGLAYLAGMKQMQYLLLPNMRISDAGLAHLAGMKQMQVLWLEDTQITDAGLAHLAGMTQMQRLQRLWLNNTQITDAGLAHLAGMTQMQYLFLTDTQITDAGLVHLAGMTQLQYLDLDHTRITDAGIQKLQTAMPKAMIHCD